MGKDELDTVLNMAGRSCLFFPGFGQSHFKHSKDRLIELESSKEREREPAQKALS